MLIDFSEWREENRGKGSRPVAVFPTARASSSTDLDLSNWFIPQTKMKGTWKPSDPKYSTYLLYVFIFKAVFLFLFPAHNVPLFRTARFRERETEKYNCRKQHFQVKEHHILTHVLLPWAKKLYGMTLQHTSAIIFKHTYHFIPISYNKVKENKRESSNISTLNKSWFTSSSISEAFIPEPAARSLYGNHSSNDPFSQAHLTSSKHRSHRTYLGLFLHNTPSLKNNFRLDLNGITLL